MPQIPDGDKCTEQQTLYWKQAAKEKLMDSKTYCDALVVRH